MTLEKKLSKIALLLDSSNYALALTGVNLAQTAGIPDFHQAQVNSCHSENTCHSECQHNCSENCSPQQFTLANFKKKPENIYKICFSLLQAIASSQPSKGYQIITLLEQLKFIRRSLTENVDTLHQIAGTQNILELNGNMRGAACLECAQKIPLGDLIDKIKHKEMPPLCPQCHGLIKPNINFEDENNPKDFQIAQEEIEKTDLLLIIGSNLDQPRSRYLANKASRLIIINTQPTPFDSKADVVVIEENLNYVLTSLWEQITEELGL